MLSLAILLKNDSDQIKIMHALVNATSKVVRVQAKGVVLFESLAGITGQFETLLEYSRRNYFEKFPPCE